MVVSSSLLKNEVIMLHDERVTYSEIKTWVLEAYYDFCRDRGIVNGLPHLQILGYIDYNYEVTFERTVEQIMFRMTELILSGGWYVDLDSNIRGIIFRYIIRA